MKKYKLVWLTFVVLLMGFIGREHALVPGSNTDTFNNSSGKLRQDGIYVTDDNCGNSIYPINIINDSLIDYHYGMQNLNDYFLKLESYLRILDRDKIDVGHYKIKSDTIFAYNLSVPLEGAGGLIIKSYGADFMGIIKNRDTITDWHMIPPYPKGSARRINKFKFLTTPRMLYFIESKELSGLDSLYRKLLAEEKEREK